MDSISFIFVTADASGVELGHILGIYYMFLTFVWNLLEMNSSRRGWPEHQIKNEFCSFQEKKMFSQRNSLNWNCMNAQLATIYHKK